MRHVRPSGLAVFATALLLTACGDEGPTSAPSPSSTSDAPTDAVASTTPTPETSGSLAHLVPAERRGATLILGFPDDNPSPLLGNPADGEADGALPDLVAAAIDLLGLSASYEAVPQVDALDPLTAGELDVYVGLATGVHGIADQADAVTYLEEQETFLIGDGLDVGPEPADLCGLRVGYDDSDDEHVGALTEFSASCTAVHDLAPIDLQEFTDETGPAREAVVAGELDAAITDSFYGEWFATEHPGLSIGGPVLAESYWALLVGKDNGLVEPLAAAIDELVANGTYEQIMTDHGVPSMPPAQATVNPTAE